VRSLKHTLTSLKKMHIYDDKVYFSQLSFVRPLAQHYEICVIIMCARLIPTKKNREGKEGAKKSWEAAGEGINKKKVFYLQNIFTSKHQQREHEKMSHSAMH
jgi:hypothetical protein